MKPELVLAIVVSGTWAFNFVYKDGTHTQGYCTFRQEASRVTGACGPETSGGEPLSGEIDGDRLTWRVDDAVSYAASVDAAGSFMRGSFNGAGDGIFTASKTNLKTK
jgi:hypothetical protein